MKNTRINGLRTKKDGSKVQAVCFDLPQEIAEKIEEIKKKTGISKNILFLKALRILILTEDYKNI